MQRSWLKFAPAACAGVFALVTVPRQAAADSIDSFANSVSAVANGVAGTPIEIVAPASYVGSVDSVFASGGAESSASALQVSEVALLADGFTVASNGSLGTSATAGGASQAASLFDLGFTLTAARSFVLNFTRLDEDGVLEPGVFALNFSGPSGLVTTSAGVLTGILGPGSYSLSVAGDMTSAAGEPALRVEGFALQLTVSPAAAAPPPVPLPAAAWGGLVLLGGMGAARLRRGAGEGAPVR
jgi:hypothetical protein